MSWELHEVRGSNLDDLAALASLCLGETWSRSAFEQTQLDSVARIRLVSDASAGLIGFLVTRRIADLVEIDLLGVSPDWRRNGIARVLLEDLIDFEATRQAVELRLELRESNNAASALYLGLGFVVVGKRARYYPDGENALLWTRTLSA